EIDWSNYLDEYSSAGKTHFESEKKDRPGFETFLASRTTLKDHLLWQFAMTGPTREQEIIGSLIVGNLDEKGYLDASVEGIAHRSNIDPQKVARVLALMQTFDPIGIGARDLKECLLIQVRHFKIDNSLVTNLINHHLNHLENKNYKAISSALKVSIGEIVSAVAIIKSLEPRPGREFNEEEPIYITPDIYVYKIDGEFVIMLNDDGMPKLRINNFYRQAVRQGREVSAQTQEYIKEKFRSATWLIRSIHQRQKTIYKVMESILRFQRDFFEHGVTHLKPMVLRDVADDIEMHESTISRVTTNKYAFTPRGIFELKYFFNSSIKRIYGDAVASASVQAKIRQIIAGENPKKPYSDKKIEMILKESNIDIARRTVAKYREILGVLSSSKRKQF
ncbi:MAG: RNA polymerase factor sigma-54, partial [Deltaproteobacteria bacterium]|nr:RNA polymerase factor sigma-54 [Deltaproteobacteria bacterium]